MADRHTPTNALPFPGDGVALSAPRGSQLLAALIIVTGGLVKIAKIAAVTVTLLLGR
jgi:hypothetical protein